MYKKDVGAGLLARVAAVLQKPVPRFFLFSSPGTRELMNFCHQLAAMLSAGIPVLLSLEILEEQTGNLGLKREIYSVARRVEQGDSLTGALTKAKGIFSPFFVGMVEAGETGGLLDRTMQYLAQHFEKKSDLEQRIKAATAYPKFVSIIILGVILFLLTFVIPSFAGTFTAMGAELPLLTKAILTLGKGMNMWWPFLVVGVSACYPVFRIMGKTKRAICYRDYLLLRLPLIGPLYHKLLIARFCRTLGIMLGSGVGLLTALSLAKHVVDNSIFNGHIERVKEDIARGETVAAAAADLLPRPVIGMIRVGEQAGNLEEMLERAALLYESEIDFAVDRLGSLIEPVLIMFLSIVVGGIVLSVFLPLFQVFEGLL